MCRSGAPGGVHLVTTCARVRCAHVERRSTVLYTRTASAGGRLLGQPAPNHGRAQSFANAEIVEQVVGPSCRERRSMAIPLGTESVQQVNVPGALRRIVWTDPEQRPDVSRYRPAVLLPVVPHDTVAIDLAKNVFHLVGTRMVKKLMRPHVRSISGVP